jgi:PhnB protein
MAAKRGSRSSKSTRKSTQKSARTTTRKSAGRGTDRRSARGPGIASRVKNTARKVLFGSLAVAGYVSDVARQRKRRAGQSNNGVKPIPDGYRTVTPYLIVRDVARLIEFLGQAFGATERMRAPRPDGSIMHAEVMIGDSLVMMGEPAGALPPMPGCLHLYVVDTDALYHLALQAGATSVREPTNQFYGDRMACVQDPAGNQWWIATHVEDIPPAEMARRAAAQSRST